LPLQVPLPLSWLAGRAVLVAADDGGSLGAMLAQAGMQVRACTSVRAAQAELSNDRPALVVLAASLPEAPTLARTCFERPGSPPLLLVGGAGEVAMPAGATIATPVSRIDLLQNVLDLLGAQTGETMTPAPVVIPSVATHGAPFDDDGGSGLRILLAEDNPVNQRLALRLLEKMGHRITLVDNGHEALERGMRGGFDLILMDVQMPGLDGLTATRHIRQWEQEHGGHVPIIAMTARAMQGDRERCLEAGMDDYLSKPIDSERLRQLVSQFDIEADGPVLAWRNALVRLDGDTGLLLELAEIFIDDGPHLLQSLSDALEAGDLAASQRAVHSLKGVLVNFGASKAVALADRVSASLHDPAQQAQWKELAGAFGPVLDEVYGALRELIAGGPDAMV
jgi:CheY-like chemotaxis protein